MTQRTGPQLLHRFVAFLQTVERAPLDLQERSQLRQGNAALAVDTIGAWQFFARIARPDDADTGSFLPA
jgi:hypothetical protein